MIAAARRSARASRPARPRRDDIFRRPPRRALLEQPEQIALHAEAADRDGQLDHRDGEGIGAEQGDAEQPGGDEHEEQARAEADRIARRGRAAAAQDQPVCVSAGCHCSIAPQPDAPRSHFSLYPQPCRMTKRQCRTRPASNRASRWSRSFAAPVFNPSETFLQAQAAGLTRYQPLIVGLEDKGHALAGAGRPAPDRARRRRPARDQAARLFRRAGPPPSSLLAGAGPRPFRDRRAARSSAGARARRSAGDDAARLRNRSLADAHAALGPPVLDPLRFAPPAADGSAATCSSPCRKRCGKRRWRRVFRRSARSPTISASTSTAFVPRLGRSRA